MKRVGTVYALALVATLVAPVAAVQSPEHSGSVEAVRQPYYDANGFDESIHRGFRSHQEQDAINSLMGGRWQVAWNSLTGTVHDLYGGAKRIYSGTITEHGTAEQIARQYLATSTQLFGASAEQLVLDRIEHSRNRWYVHFRQFLGGIPVHGAYARVQVTDDGRLIRAMSSFHPQATVPAQVVASQVALQVATHGVLTDPAHDRVRDDGVVLLPLPDGQGGVDYRLTQALTVETAVPAAQWATYVDLTTGDIVWRQDQLAHVEQTGNVSGNHYEVGPCDGPEVAGPFEDLRVDIDGVGFDDTDDAGNYAIDVPDGLPHPVDFELKGVHCKVFNQAPGEPDALISETGTPGTPLDVFWDDTNSQADERTCYIHQNRIYDFAKAVLAGRSLLQLEAQFPCNVSLDPAVHGTCNAFYNGSSINFYQEGGGCNNTGILGEVVYHEYGHGLVQALWGTTQNGTQLSEGFPDIYATLMTRDPRVGRGFYTASCNLVLRNCNNTLQYPGNLTGQAHSDGRIICGFSWDTYQNFLASGLPNAESLWDSLVYYTGDSGVTTGPDVVTQWFLDDDDDGIISNGSPNYDDICDAAMQHGYMCPELFVGVLVEHEPLEDTSNTTVPYTVLATIGSTEAAMDSTVMSYSVDFAAYQTLNMTPTGNPNEYSADIPAQPLGSLVRYYIIGADQAGFRATSPDGAPGISHSFVVGSLQVREAFDMEADDGWVVGETIPPDNATAGVWERGDPVGVFAFIAGNPILATPEDDHSAVGTDCWFTEQDEVGGVPGAHDVDGGRTTLRSPIFDVAGEDYVRFQYYRWFTNALGANGSEDPWTVGVSTNGGVTYTTIEEALISESDWVEVNVVLNGVVPFTNNMRVRFVAVDLESQPNGPSVVEAAVDDLTISVWDPSTSAVGGAVASPTLVTAMHQNRPNPFNPVTTIEYSVADAGPLALNVYSVGGQLVRTLVDGQVDAGSYSVAWDGRDQRGVPVASGVYYYKIEAPEFTQTRKMVLMK